MEEKHYGGAWIAVAVVVVLGILLATGVFGNVSGSLKTTLTIIGIICLVIGFIITAITVAVIIIAIKTSKPDKASDEKLAIRDIISGKEQEIAKIKSFIAVTNIDIKRANSQKNTTLASQLQASIDEANERLANLQKEVIELKSRRDAAVSKLSDADSILNGDEKVISDFEQKAQYEKDYADSLKELNGQ